MNDDNKTPVGNCTKCGRNAQYNSPALDASSNLVCDNCADKDRSNTIFYSINQFKINGEYEFTGGVVLNGVVVWKDKSAWIEGGSRGTHLTEEEKKLTPTEIAHILNVEFNGNGILRCTGCGTKMKKNEVASYPLFAGVACKECDVKHKQNLENERAKGHVCRMCGQPYGNCCC